MLLDFIARTFEQRATWHVSGGHPRDPALADILGFGQTAKSGVVVTEKTAMTHSPVWRAVNLRSIVMGDIPLSVYQKRPDGGKDTLSNHHLYPIVHDVCNSELYMTAFTRQQLAENHSLTWGNECSWIERRRNGKPVNLWPHPAGMVSMDTTKSGKIVYIFAGVREPDKDYDPADVLHHKGMSPDGLWGWSRIRQARESIGQALAAQQFGGSWFGNGSRPGVIVTTLPGFRPEDAKKMKESVIEQTGGPENWNRPLVLPGADKIILTTVPPEDAQFLGTQEFGVAEAGRWFDVPLVFMMLPNSEPRANAEQDSLNFVKFTIAPECKSQEQELNLKLLSPAERAAGIFIEYNVDSLLRGDFKSRMEGYHIAVNDGISTRDEVRRKENWDPLGSESGGDVITIPVNSMNIKAVLNQTEPPGQKPVADAGDNPPAKERSVDWLAVYEPMIADAAKRLLDKEEKAVHAAIKKHGTLKREHLADFYDGHADAVRFVVAPIVNSMSAGDKRETIVIEDASTAYCRDAKRAEWPKWKSDGAARCLRHDIVAAIRLFKGSENGKDATSAEQN